MPRDIQPNPFPLLFQPLVHVATGSVHSVRATGGHVSMAMRQGWLEQAAWRLLEGAAQIASIWHENGWMVPFAVHLGGAQLHHAVERRLQARIPRWLESRGLPGDAVLFEPGLKCLLAPKPVDDLLDWYRLQDSSWILACGDFICPPTPAWRLPQAVQDWAAHFRVISAPSNLPDSIPY